MAEDRTAIRGHRAWRITGTSVVALAVVCGGAQTWGLVVQQQRTSDRSYPVAATRVHLDTGSAAVQIRPGQPGRVLVTEHLDWTVRSPRVETVFDGDVLNVRMRCNQVVPVVDLGCGAVIELEVPPTAAVDGGGSSGSIDIKGLSGDVRVAATSGAVQLSGLSGPVYARTTSGAVRATGLTSARVEVHATSGAVDLGFAGPPHAVAVGVTSGEVSLALPQGSGYRFGVDRGSGNGHIDPRLSNPASPDTVQVTSTSGALSVNPVDG